MAKENKEDNPLQIAKFNSLGCLMEILDAFSIGKVKINIAPFNTQTHKQIAMGSFYLNFNEWFAISQRIQTGSLIMEAYNEKVKTEQAKANGQTYYMQDLYMKYSGTAAGKLKQERQRGVDASGNPISEARVLRIFPSMKSYDKIMFAILTGDGKVGDKGQIEPTFNVKLFKSDARTTVTQIPVDYNELRGYCQLIDARINAFIIKQTLDGVYVSNYQPENREGISNAPLPTQDLNPKDNVTVFSEADVAGTNNVIPMNAYQQNIPQNAIPQNTQAIPQQQVVNYQQTVADPNAYPQTIPTGYMNQYMQ